MHVARNPFGYLKDVAYFIPNEDVGDICIKYSSNAWWMDRTKVYTILGSLRAGYKVKDGCALAGISTTQLKFFEKKHPEFKALKKKLREEVTLHAFEIIKENAVKGMRPALRFMKKLKRRKGRDDLLLEKVTFEPLMVPPIPKLEPYKPYNKMDDPEYFKSLIKEMEDAPRY